MDYIMYVCSYIISTLVEVWIISRLMKLFLGIRADNKNVYVKYILRILICTIQYIIFPYAVLNVTVGILTLFFIALSYDGSMKKKIFVSIIIYIIGFIAETMVAAIFILTGVPVLEHGYNGNAFSNTVSTLLFVCFYYIIRAFKNISTELKVPTSFFAITMVFSMVLVFMEMIIFPQESIKGEVKVISALCMLIAFVLEIYFYDVISLYYKKKVQSEVIEREKNYYMNQMQLLEKTNLEIRKIKHDITNHLFAISTLANESNNEVKNYIDSILGKIEENTVFSSTGNIAIDSIINYKLSMAKKIDAKIEHDFIILDKIEEDIEDIVTILGNLLDNAVEAIQTIEKNRYLGFTLKYKQGVMFIEVKNSYDGIVKKNGKQIVSKKEDNRLHGIGLRSVEAVVDAHDGKMDIVYDENEFKVNIAMYV